MIENEMNSALLYSIPLLSSMESNSTLSGRVARNRAASTGGPSMGDLVRSLADMRIFVA